MITIKEFYGDVKDIDESVLAVKSDCLWEKGSLLDIKNLVTPQLFHLHILVNLGSPGKQSITFSKVVFISSAPAWLNVSAI